MDDEYQINYETPTTEDSTYVGKRTFGKLKFAYQSTSAYQITQMPNDRALALVRALKAKHCGNMDAVWAELDRLAIKLLGYPLSQKYKGAKIDL